MTREGNMSHRKNYPYLLGWGGKLNRLSRRIERKRDKRVWKRCM